MLERNAKSAQRAVYETSNQYQNLNNMRDSRSVQREQVKSQQNVVYNHAPVTNYQSVQSVQNVSNYSQNNSSMVNASVLQSKVGDN